MKPSDFIVLVSVLAQLAGGGACAAAHRPTTPSADKPVFMNAGLVIPNDELQSVQDRALAGDGPAAKRLYSYFAIIKHSQQEAIYWATIGAENGDIVCAYNLGYELKARGGRDDKIRAIYWLEKAKAAKHPYAEDLLKELGR